MPIFPHFDMNDNEHDQLEKALKPNELGGVCVAWSLHWLELVYANGVLPKSFAEMDLNKLVEQQKAYLDIARQKQGNEGFLAYCVQRGFTVKRINGGKLSARIYEREVKGAEIYDFETVKLDPNTGYVLSFYENNIGEQKAHVLALYRTEVDGQPTIQISDQNVGQMEVSNEAELVEKYQEVFEGYFKEYYQQVDEEKQTGGHMKVTLPKYSRWTLYQLTRI